MDLKVFISSRSSSCEECREDLGHGAWIFLAGERGALCLVCADLDHLVYLPAGDTALTRRTRANSTLVAVVLKWSKARKRYERQGLLVEEEALATAETRCLADGQARERRRERQARRRAELDLEYIARFARRVREIFPGCPSAREVTIAEHACRKYSDRIGRSAAAKDLEENAVRLAVVAHLRHSETPYDSLLAQGLARPEARAQVRAIVDQVLAQWAES